MNPSSSNSRRSFVKKSVALTIAASQPAFLAGLVKASGGGGSGSTQETKTDETTDPFTTYPDSTTVPDTTTAPEPETTTIPETPTEPEPPTEPWDITTAEFFF